VAKKCACGSLMDKYDVGWVCFECEDGLIRKLTKKEEQAHKIHGQRFKALNCGGFNKQEIKRALKISEQTYDALVFAGGEDI